MQEIEKPLHEPTLRKRLTDHFNLVEDYHAKFDQGYEDFERTLSQHIQDEQVATRLTETIVLTLEMTVLGIDTEWLIAMHDAGISEKDILKVWDTKKQKAEVRENVLRGENL